MFSAAEKKTLLTLCTVYFSRMTGLFIIIPILAIYSGDFEGFTPATLGIALGVYGFTQGLLLLPFGLLSDIFGRRNLILIGLGFFVIGSVVAATADNMTILIIGRALQGAGAIAGVLLTVTTELIRDENRGIAMAMIGACIGIAFALALIISPVIADIGGIALAFWLCAGLAIFSALLVIWQIPKLQPQAQHSEVLTSSVRRLKGQLKNHIFSNTQLMLINVSVFILHFLQMSLWVAIPLLLENNFDIDRSQHWHIYLQAVGGSFLVMLLVMRWFGKTPQRTHWSILLSIVMIVLGQLLMWQMETLTGFSFGLFLFFLGFCYLESRLPALVSRLYSEHLKGATMGAYSSFQFFGIFCGGVAGGLVVQNFGEYSIFLSAALISSLWFFYYLLKGSVIEIK